MEYSKIYLNNYIPNEDTSAKKKNLIGTVSVFGTYNSKKQCREEYEIKIFKNDPKSMFFCSCADHKFNSTKKNIMCKHISFLICKVGKILKPSVFENKQLVAEDLAILLGRLSPNETIWNNPDLSKIKMKLEVFMQFTKAIDDCCPLCYNDLSDDDKPLLLSCPTCKNYIHKECAEIWMECKECCAFCKSDIWKHYKEVK